MVHVESIPSTSPFSTFSAPSSSQKISQSLPEGCEKATGFCVSQFKKEQNWHSNTPFTAVDKAFAKLTGEVYKQTDKTTRESLAYTFFQEIAEASIQPENFNADRLNQLLDQTKDLESGNVQPLLREAKELVQGRRDHKPEKYKNIEQVAEFINSKIDADQTGLFIKTPREFVQVATDPKSAARANSRFHFPSLSTILKVAVAATVVGLGVGYYLHGMPAAVLDLANYLPFRSAGNNTDLIPPQSEGNLNQTFLNETLNAEGQKVEENLLNLGVNSAATESLTSSEENANPEVKTAESAVLEMSVAKDVSEDSVRLPSDPVV